MNDFMSGDKYEDKSINSFVTTLEYDKNYSIGTLQLGICKFKFNNWTLKAQK